MGYPIRWDELPAFEIQPQQRVEEKAERTVSLRAYCQRLTALTLACSGILVLVVMGVFSVILNGNQPAPLRLAVTPAATQLAASAPVAVRRVGYVSVTGNVTNRTAHPIQRIEAVVDLLDADGHAIRTQSAMVQPVSLSPGQSSPYAVELRDEKSAASFRVHFKQLYGADLK